MKIKNIKINSYGNLKNKEIDLENINIIYGENESGKSTLLNFIKNIFYGISKNKNGREISDYEKYTPWEEGNFSGKIKYELESGENFEVYRDFNKKNPEIYNESLEEISNQFTIDKKIGNQFFYEQTNLDEDTFVSTAFAMQREIKIDNNKQANLIQKIANISETGAEDVSYKKALTDLNSMLLNEVGTNNSKDRPINITKEKIYKYQNELDEISSIKENRFHIENNVKEYQKELEEKELNEKLYNRIKKVLDDNKIEKEKINIKTNILEENRNKVRKLDNEKDSLINKLQNDGAKKEDKNNKKAIKVAILLILITINILNFIFIKNTIANVAIVLLIPIYLCYFIISNKSKSKTKDTSEITNKMKVLDGQIEILEKNNEDIEKEIVELKNKTEEIINKQKQEIAYEFNELLEDEIEKLFDKNIEYLIETNKRELNELNLKLHKLELDRQNINPEIEKIINLEENLDIEKENLRLLEKKSEEYSLAKELLEEAYTEMKKNVSPKFNTSLSRNLEKISNGKYKNIISGDMLTIELEDGRYVSAESLSIGTIEQIYLSLRLSVMEELSKEKLPIMLDEAFAYYDDERLKSALEYLSKTEHQVIIFTCTNREKEALEKMGITYNYIKL